MKPIYLKPGQTVAVIPIRQIGIAPGIGYVCNHGKDNAKEWAECCAPYLPGEKCYVPETWCKSIVEGIIYKDGYDVPDAPRWRPAVTMPAKHARRFVTIVSCEPVKVSEVTWQDAIKAGVEARYCCSGVDCACMGLPIDNPADDFKENWYKKHPGKQWAWRVITEEVKT